MVFDGLEDFELLDDLENQLNVLDEEKKRQANNPPFKQEKRFTSKKSCSLYEFISMLQKITERTIGRRMEITFSPNEGEVPIESFSEQLSGGYITYSLLSREPMNEIGYRLRETIVEEDKYGKPARQGEVLGQKQKAYIQFNFFAGTVEEVESIMNEFEENMILYTGYFMANGMGKIIFNKQLTDKSLDQFRQTTSVRSLIYYVELEKLIEKFDEDIISIDVFNNN